MPSQESKEYFRKKMVRRTKQMLDLLEANAPERIVANSVLLILQMAIAYCGEQVSLVLTEWLVKNIRREMAFCQRCDHRVEERHCSAPLCKCCELADALEEVESEDLVKDRPVEFLDEDELD